MPISPTVILRQPDGTTRSHPHPGPNASSSLAHWLERQGWSLQTRCGQRGWCRGCQVILECASGPQIVRSCQLDIRDLPSDLEGITQPAASCRTEALSGLQDFSLANGLPTPRTRTGLGMAIDIGTTTVAAALWDLSTGRCLATAARPNAQRRFGDNVVSRIAHGSTPDGVRELQAVLVHGTLRPLIDELLARSASDRPLLGELVVAGNTVMLHTLVGASLAGLGMFPFRPEFLGAQRLTAKAIGLDLDAELRLLPSLGPFVGADITAGALAAGLLEPGPPALLVDFGTNGELLLRVGERYLATATAVGPAFEGGRLNWGTTAGPGAVTRLAYADGIWQPTVLPPAQGATRGLAGSAYLDILAIARRCGMISQLGRLDASHQAVGQVIRDGAPERCLWINETLYVSEADLAELLQAKAAIAAGIATLLEVAGLAPSDLDTLHLAGGFGYHLPVRHAMAIGLIPTLDDDRIRIIGNSALGGASHLLLTEDPTILSPLFRDPHLVELNQVPSFEDHFIDALSLDPW